MNSFVVWLTSDSSLQFVPLTAGIFGAIWYRQSVEQVRGWELLRLSNELLTSALGLSVGCVLLVGSRAHHMSELTGGRLPPRVIDLLILDPVALFGAVGLFLVCVAVARRNRNKTFFWSAILPSGLAMGFLYAAGWVFLTFNRLLTADPSKG